jgi:glycosyltransferase involved in cell wall biosynthesis
LIRVLRVITRLNVGGPSKQILTLNSIFDGIEFEQLIIAGQVSESEKEIDLSSLGKVIKIKSLQRGFSPLNELISILQVSMIIRRYKPDIIHTHLSKAWAITILAKGLSRVNCKVIHTFHGHILHSYFSKWRMIILKQIQKYLAYKSDFLVAVNELTKDELIEAEIGSETKFIVINPGFKPILQQSKRESRRMLGLAENFFTVGFVGRFEAIKRPDILSLVINTSIKNIEHIQFIVCGGGALYDDFKQETANSRVHYLPWVDDLTPIYSSMDLMLLTSDNEGSPLTIIEAGQLGIPTLSRAVGGVATLITHESTGFLAGDDPQVISTSLLHVFKSPDLLSIVSSQTKTFFLENYGESRFLSNYVKLYNEANLKS